MRNPYAERRCQTGGEIVMISFGSDMTLRWACRAGDYVFWARFQGLFSSPGHEYKIADIWELHDGNFVTATNRPVDLPVWLDLHPLEVSGSLVWWMRKRLDEGYKPNGPLQGPNIWSFFAGDRVVWVGPERGGVEFNDGVLGLLDFMENALVYGEPFDLCWASATFGGFDREQPPQEGARVCQAGWGALIRLPLPRVIAADRQWRVG
jgi:hypothetical protein